MMATAVPARSAPTSKMKRPPPAVVQTAVNGVMPSQSSPSPSLSSKRPPVGFKHPSTAGVANGLNGATNGTGPRISNRRRDSQRPSDGANRPSRLARTGGSESAVGDKRVSKRQPEPYGT
jgi:hypothetical protein